jgi:hypothetical protein
VVVVVLVVVAVAVVVVVVVVVAAAAVAVAVAVAVVVVVVHFKRINALIKCLQDFSVTQILLDKNKVRSATCFGLFIKPSSGCTSTDLFHIQFAVSLNYDVSFTLEY